MRRLRIWLIRKLVGTEYTITRIGSGTNAIYASYSHGVYSFDGLKWHKIDTTTGLA